MPDDRPLHIALVSIEYPPDPYASGIGTYTKTLAEGLAARGHHVHVVTRGREGSATRVIEQGVVVHRVSPARPKLPTVFSPAATVALALRGLAAEVRYRRRLATLLHRLVREEGLDLIEAADHAAEAGFYRPRRHPLVPFIVRLHVPVAVTERYDRNLPEPARRAVRALERRFLRSATHLSAVSARSNVVIAREMNLEPAPTVIPNPPPFDPAAVAVDQRAVDPDLVTFVGRVNRWKGADLLVRAIPEIRRRRPATRFVFVGALTYAVPGFASMRDYLMSLLPEADHSAVAFTDRVPLEAVAAHYHRAAVCVFPSRFEVFGYVCLEAMAHGKAIVASDQGGMAELLDEGACGLLFTPPDVDALAGQVLRVLDDPALRADLGERARRRVLEHYDRDALLTRTEAFYRQAIADRRAGAAG